MSNRESSSESSEGTASQDNETNETSEATETAESDESPAHSASESHSQESVTSSSQESEELTITFKSAEGRLLETGETSLQISKKKGNVLQQRTFLPLKIRHPLKAGS